MSEVWITEPLSDSHWAHLIGEFQMPLHPQCQAIVEAVADNPEGSPFTADEPADARARYVASNAIYAPDTPSLAKISDFAITGPADDILVRLYNPSASDDKELPIMVFVHGGGWVFGDLESHDHVCRALAHEAGCLVLAVDYRLAPEYPFPAGLEDCMAVLAWVSGNAASLGADSEKLAIGGDSAGGNLSAVMAQEAQKNGGPNIAFQLLLYPATDFLADNNSLRDNAEGYLLTKEAITRFADLYLRDGQDRRDPRISPIYGDLAGLPPAHVITAEFDPLRDEGATYAEAMKSAGVDVTYAMYPGMVHGFMRMGAIVDNAQDAIRESAVRLKQVLSYERP